MRIAYLDCFAGIAGDMFVGALADAGVPHAVLEEATAALGLGARLHFETVDRSGIAATKVHVLEGDELADAPRPGRSFEHTPALDSLPFQAATAQHPAAGHAHPHTRAAAVAEPDTCESEEVQGRSLTMIRQLIHDSSLSSEVKLLATRTFDLLGKSEANIHNVSVDDIHFHEVGAVDAIVDIVASAAGIVHLQIDAWQSSPVNVGGGIVRCAHGLFPVPAPATADLLRGMPTYSAHVQKELVTPTGAALLRALSPVFGPQPAMTVRQIGYGAGTRNPPGFPNVVRLSIGDVENSTPSPFLASVFASSAETVTVLETALDDTTPQVLAYVAEQALQQGALDVMLAPVTMKKGRPGTLLTVLARPEDTDVFTNLLLRETTTLGLRVRQDRRVLLDRDHTTVETPYGSIRMKTGSLQGDVLNAHPEFEDCRRAAQASGVPLKRVQTAALAAFAGTSERNTKA